MRFTLETLSTLAALLLAAGPALAQDRPIVAVFDIEVKGPELDRATVERLTDYLDSLIAKKGFQVVPRSQLEERLTEEKKRSYRECYDQGCQIEIGQELAAQKSLASRVLKIGSQCMVTVNLYDLRRAASDGAGTAGGRCGEDEVVASLEKAVDDLLSRLGDVRRQAEEAPKKVGPAEDRERTIEGEAGKEPTEGEAGRPLTEVPRGMVRFPAGEFLMGCSPGDGECNEDEKPAHEVWVSEFFMDATEVTVAAYRRCVEAGKCRAPRAGSGCTYRVAGKEDHPVNCVDWNQARSYCEWAGKRLPTEAEWEKAARGGTTGSRYGELDALAWYDRNSGGGTQPAGKKQPNGHGLSDMLGNVSEWCGDRYVGGFYRESPARDPGGPESGELRVVRGGSWLYGPGVSRASERAGSPPDRVSAGDGFRCASSLAVADEGQPGAAGAEAVSGGAAGGAALTWVFSRPADLEFTRSEITVAQYRACVEAGKCGAPSTSTLWCNWGKAGRGDHPVNCLSYDQATAFCAWAGGRLPTDKEWNAEASDGGKRRFPWGDKWPSCERVIWNEEGLGSGCGKGQTWPVCSKPAGNSVSGLCDMAGNVWEWTSTFFLPGVSNCRGSSYAFDSGLYMEVSGRHPCNMGDREDGTGFRCVRLPR